MKQKFENLASLVFNQAHLVTPEYAETIMCVLADKLHLDAEGLFIQGEEAREQEETKIKGNGTYVLSILGSMTHRASSLDALSGIQSYSAIKAELQEALNNPQVKSIILDMDSPGGTVAGAFDLRDFILESRGTKPIVALANDNMNSAAYLIGSAADEVYITQTGKAGSIGVVAMHIDRSKQNEEAGVKPTFIYAGDYKTAGNPHEPLGEDSLGYLQESVNQSYDMFVKAVAETRGLSEQAVRDTEARVYMGEKAVSAGLADGVTTMDALLEKLAQEPRVVETKSRGKMMDNDMETLAAELASAQEQVEKLTTDNESLRGHIIAEGYVITAEGISRKEEPEMMEFNGEMVAKADIPAPVLEALEASAKEKADAELTAKAKTELPNFDLNVAKSLLSGDLSDETLTALKSADAALDAGFEEQGESDADGEMGSADSMLDAMVQDYMKENDVDEIAAFAAVAATAEGARLVNKSYKGE